MERRRGIERPRNPELLWTGDDVRLVENIVFNPSGSTGLATQALVECDLEDFPDPNKLNSSRNQIRQNVKFSYRSRFAQLGLHTDSREIIDDALSNFLFARHEGKKAFQFYLPVSVVGGAPVGVTAETGLGRFYMEPEAYIVEKELERLMNNGDILIDGEEGREWLYYKEPNNIGMPIKAGIMLRIKDENRVYIPESTEPMLLVVGDDNEYRKEVSRFHKPIHKDDIQDNTFWIGETADIFLNENVTAIIDRFAHPTSLGNTPNTRSALHSESRRVDAGSAWPIKVEIVGKANWVVFRICHQEQKAA